MSWIATDPDVEPFYKKALEGKAGIFDEPTWHDLDKLFFHPEPEKASEAPTQTVNIADIPF